MSKSHRIKDYICTSCGKIVREYEQRMWPGLYKNINRDICLECSSWLELAEHPKPYCQVINGQYFIFPPVVRPECKASHILTIDGELLDSTELCNYGHIPERFKHLFPTTAHFIPFHTRRKIVANQRTRCKRLGCWDRLHCLWFNEENEDWNVIPGNHKIGGEKCPLFIDKFNPK